jgi:CBS domain-containing protein
MNDQPISTLMQRRVAWIGMDDSAEAAERLLQSQGLSWAPVVGDNGEPVGVISVDDLERFRVGKGDAAGTPAWRLCTYRPVSVSPDTTVAAVAKLMVDRRIHHVVIAERGELKGVVSSLDLVRTLV